MQFTVQLYLDGTPIDSSDVPSLKINSATVQRIVNRVARRCVEAQSETLQANTGGIMGGYGVKREAAQG